MAPIGQCAICYSSLYSSDAYAIKSCGHTFHENCAKQWLKEGKCCSSCRAKATENDVMKLFIQESGMDDTFASQNVAAEQLVETERKYEELTNTHKKTLEEKNRMEAETRKLHKRISLMEKEVENARVLQGRLNSMEDVLQNSQAIEQKLKEAEHKLKASTFYELLTSKGQTEEEYKKFVDSNGVINGDAFLAQSRNENKKLKKQLEESQAAQKKLEKDYEVERKKSLQRKDAIAKLTAEIKALQEAAVKKNDPPTPDPRLVNILNHSPPPTSSRKSLGFSFESPVFPRSVVESVQPPKRAKKRIIISDDEDDAEEENVPPVSVSNKKKSPPKKPKAFSFSSDDDDDDPPFNPSNEASFNVPAAVPRFTRQNSSNKNLGSKFGTSLSDKRPAVEKVTRSATAAAAKTQKISDAAPATKKIAAKPKALTVTRRATAPKTQKVSNVPAASLDDSIVCLD